MVTGETADGKKALDLQEVQPELQQEYLPTILGTEIIIRLHRLFRGVALYDRNNMIIERLTRECLEAILPLIQSENQLSLKIVRENFFCNNIRIQVQADKYAIFKGFSQELKKRWVEELEFSGDLQAEQLKEFIFFFCSLEEGNEGNYLLGKQWLESKGIETINLGKLESFKGEGAVGEPGRQRHYSKVIYFQTINLAREVYEGARSQKLINIRKAKHLMQSAVSAIMQDESALLGLANIKNYDEYTFNHSVNVAIYAIALGQRIGVPKKHLSDLGMAGLFHDIGKTKIPKEVLNKTEKLTSDEWNLIRSHPVIGAEIVIRMKEWGELSTRMIDAAFEHHLKFDLSGYPKLARKRNVSLFGRIITLADFYDALVRPRVYRRFPYVSEKILGLMLERAGKDFDPALVKVFINMIGIFPLGTLVLLNTNEMGIVLEIQEDPDLIDRPKVCLLHYREGEYRKGPVVDLREQEGEEASFKRSIVKTLDPNEYNLHVAEFLL